SAPDFIGGTSGSARYFALYGATGDTLQIGFNNGSYVHPATAIVSIPETGNTVFANPLQAPSVSSSSANPAASGFPRAASGDQYCWRNNANSGDVCLSKNSSDQLLFNGSAVGGGGSGTVTG